MTLSRQDALNAMRWLSQAGVDTIVLDSAPDRSAPRKLKKSPPRKVAATPQGDAPTTSLAQAGHAQSLAAAATTLDELKRAMLEFDGCALKNTATQLVFSDGPADADIMLIGEAPGRDEDREGKPFVGAAGQLLNKMLAATGHPRESVYISNIVPWRPPGNRKPTPLETQICLPFIERHIALKAPKLIILLGATPANTLIGKTDGITRLRGQWHQLSIGGQTYQAMPTFHPAYLLRQPAHKKFAWRDMLDAVAHLEATRDDRSGGES